MNKQNAIEASCQMMIDKHVSAKVIVQRIAEQLSLDKTFVLDAMQAFMEKQMSEVSKRAMSSENDVLIGQYGDMLNVISDLRNTKATIDETVYAMMQSAYEDIRKLNDEYDCKRSQVSIDVGDELECTMTDSEDFNYANISWYGAMSYKISCILDIIDRNLYKIDFDYLTKVYNILDRLTK